MVVSSGKMAPSTPYSSAFSRKTATMVPAAVLESGTKKSMLPPSNLPPHRTAVKSKSSSQPKDAAPPRPTKKLAKEQPVQDSVPPLSGILSRGMIATGQKSASRGNSSPSPHSTSSSSQGEGRAPIVKLSKKPEQTPGPKPRFAPSGGSELKVRIPLPRARANKADNESAATLAGMEGAASRIAGTSSSSRIRLAMSMSKSGVENVVIKMDDTHPNLDAVSSPGSDKPISPLPPTQNTPPVLPEVNAHIQDLENLLRSTTEELSRTKEDLSRIEEDRENALHRIDLYAKEHELFRAERDTAVEKCRIVVSELEVIRSATEATQEEFEKSFSELSELREGTLTLEADRTQLRQELSNVMADRDDIRMKLDSLGSVLKDTLREKDEAMQRALASEEKMTKLLEDRDGVKKEALSLKKKRLAEQETAEKCQIGLQKSLADAKSEAESWKLTTELKTAEVHKLNKEVESLRVVAEKHVGCDAELSRQTMRVQELESKVASYQETEKAMQKSLSEKEAEVKNLHRRSMLLTQQKETLEYKLKLPPSSRPSLLMTSSLSFEPDSSFFETTGDL